MSEDDDESSDERQFAKVADDDAGDETATTADDEPAGTERTARDSTPDSEQRRFEALADDLGRDAEHEGAEDEPPDADGSLTQLDESASSSPGSSEISIGTPSEDETASGQPDTEGSTDTTRRDSPDQSTEDDERQGGDADPADVASKLSVRTDGEPLAIGDFVFPFVEERAAIDDAARTDSESQRDNQKARHDAATDEIPDADDDGGDSARDSRFGHRVSGDDQESASPPSADADQTDRRPSNVADDEQSTSGSAATDSQAGGRDGETESELDFGLDGILADASSGDDAHDGEESPADSALDSSPTRGSQTDSSDFEQLATDSLSSTEPEWESLTQTLSDDVDLESATQLLVLSSPAEPVTDAVCSQLLSHGTRERNIVIVTIADAPADRARLLPDSTDDPGETVVIDVGSRNESESAAAIVGATGRDVEVCHVSSPSDVSRLGMVVDRALSDWEDSSRPTVVCFYSLSNLLQYVDPQTAFRFVHLLGNRLEPTDARVHFHMNPEEHSIESLRTFQPVFDEILRVSTDGDVEAVRI